MKLNRYYASCFNVAPVFTSDFKMPKSKGGGEFTINYMDSAFNKEAEYGEFFIEFKEAVWEYKLVEQFESYGAGQVYTATFQNIDGNESASNFLLRVWELAEKTGYRETRGECSSQLLAKAKAKLEDRKAKTVDDKEYDEKTQAVMKATLNGVNEVKNNVEGVAVKVDAVQGIVSNMQDCIANITILQADNIRLNSEIKRVNLLRDQLENKVARQTCIENKYDYAIVQIHDLNLKVKDLEEKVRTYQALDAAKWIIEQYESERSAKRARID